VSVDAARETARRALARVPFPEAVVAYLAVRVVTIVVVGVANLATHHGLVGDLSTWDGAWFLRAVEHGWPSQLPRLHGAVQANTIAFFPLFPLIVRALAHVTLLSPNVVGLVVSGLSGLVAVVSVGLLTRTYADEAAARRVALLVALSPGSFVFSLVYNEGIVISLAALGLLALTRRRWWLAGAVAALASFTSPVGLVLALCCLAAALARIVTLREWRALVAPVLAPLGLAAWFCYLRLHTGSWRAWQLTERGGWRSYPSLTYPLRVVAKFVTNPLSPTMTGQILFAGTMVAIALLVVAYRDHQPWLIRLYGTAAVALFAISSPVGLRPRFLLLAFPLAMAAGTHWLGRRFHVVVALSALTLALMTYETLTSWAVFP
jgi:hypothetical protein